MTDAHRDHSHKSARASSPVGSPRSCGSRCRGPGSPGSFSWKGFRDGEEGTSRRATRDHAVVQEALGSERAVRPSRKRCHQVDSCRAWLCSVRKVGRSAPAASRNSLNTMFHTWPVKIMNTQASSRPMLLCGNTADHAFFSSNTVRNVRTRQVLWENVERQPARTAGPGHQQGEAPTRRPGRRTAGRKNRRSIRGRVKTGRISGRA